MRLLSAILATILMSVPVSAQTAPPAAELPEREQPEKNTKGAILQALLYTSTTVEFDGIPARDAIGYIRDILQINVVGRYNDDAIGHGIDPLAPITLDLEEVPALVVLDQILEQCAVAERVTWQLRNGFLEVGTVDRLSTPGAQRTEVYPIDALISEPRQFQGPDISLWGSYRDAYNSWGNAWRGSGFGGGYGGSFGGGSSSSGSGGFGGSTNAIQMARERKQREREMAEDIVMLITDAIDPLGWNTNGGSRSTIRYTSGKLIVKAPDFVHREINGYPAVPPPPTYGASDEKKD